MHMEFWIAFWLWLGVCLDRLVPGFGFEIVEWASWLLGLLWPWNSDPFDSFSLPVCYMHRNFCLRLSDAQKEFFHIYNVPVYFSFDLYIS